MKITCPPKEHCNMYGLSFFCKVVTRVRGMALLSACPGQLFLHTVAVDLSPVHEVFSFEADPFDWRPVSIDFEVDQSSSTKALCLHHQCRVWSFLLLGRTHERMSWTVNTRSGE